jgi:hypothetical protein
MRLEEFPMKLIEARVTRNQKEEPGIQECDIWNIEATLLEALPEERVEITSDSQEIARMQLESVRLDCTRTAITIRTQGKSPCMEGDTIHVAVRKEHDKTLESSLK